jgi:hypothetical protein
MSELNKHRQTKEYKLSDHVAANTPVPHKGAQAEEYEGWANRDYSENEMKSNRDTYKDIAGDPDLIESVKEMIADKVVKHLDDVIFEMVCKEMDNDYMFTADNYLTEAGYEMFEEQWFEFYHEHHSDILAQIHNKLIY